MQDDTGVLGIIAMLIIALLGWWIVAQTLSQQ